MASHRFVIGNSTQFFFDNLPPCVIQASCCTTHSSFPGVDPCPQAGHQGNSSLGYNAEKIGACGEVHKPGAAKERKLAGTLAGVVWLDCQCSSYGGSHMNENPREKTEPRKERDKIRHCLLSSRRQPCLAKFWRHVATHFFLWLEFQALFASTIFPFMKSKSSFMLEQTGICELDIPEHPGGRH